MAKYVRTREDKIIIFPDSMLHSEFKDFNPVSAGTILWEANDDPQDIFHANKFRCYGKSVSLGIESLKEEDAELAKRQFDK